MIIIIYYLPIFPMLSNALFRAFAAIDLTEALPSPIKWTATSTRKRNQTMGCFGTINGRQVQYEQGWCRGGAHGTAVRRREGISQAQPGSTTSVCKAFGIVNPAFTFSICLISTIEPLATSLRSYWYLMFFSFTIAMIIYCYLVCHQKLARTHPHNIVFVRVYPFFWCFSRYGQRILHHNGNRIRNTLYCSCLVWSDFICHSNSSGFHVKFCLLVHSLLGWDRIWLGLSASVGQYLDQLIYSAIIGIIFSCYLVHHTQMIIGGKHRYQFEIDDYVFAAPACIWT